MLDGGQSGPSWHHSAKLTTSSFLKHSSFLLMSPVSLTFPSQSSWQILLSFFLKFGIS